MFSGGLVLGQELYTNPNPDPNPNPYRSPKIHCQYRRRVRFTCFPTLFRVFWFVFDDPCGLVLRQELYTNQMASLTAFDEGGFSATVKFYSEDVENGSMTTYLTRGMVSHIGSS